MKHKFRDAIDMIEYDDLIKMKADLESGGIHIQQMINAKIKEHEQQHDQICSACGENIEPTSTNTYTLVFGPEDFRKKATFCAVDCMEYFVNSLKEMNKKK